MNDNEQGAQGNMSIEDQARAWQVRLDREKDPDISAETRAKTKAEFEAWLAASAEHRREFEWIEKVYADGECLKDSPKFGSAREADAPPPKSRNWLMWGTAAAAAAAVLVFAFGAGGATLPESFPGGSMSARAAVPLVTQRGEIRSFRLADGSTATLDTDSRVDVLMTDTDRSLQLSQGRARFEVAPDSRPFRVRAGAGEVTASKGVIDMAYDEDRNVMVRIISGDATVGPASSKTGDAGVAKSPRQGELLAYQASDSRALPVQPEVAASLRQDWPSGWVEYRTIRLDKLIAEANRYAEKPIIVDDPATAALTASGRFRISQTDVFLERLAEVLNLSISHRSDGIHLRKR